MTPVGFLSECVQGPECRVVDGNGTDLRDHSNWSWPDIPGREDFGGQMIHTAAWPESFDVDGKTVAVIGNGASGVQVLPQIAPSTFPNTEFTIQRTS